jgi:hypothetical protein
MLRKKGRKTARDFGRALGGDPAERTSAANETGGAGV